MSQNRTHGYDLVMEVNNQVMNDHLPTEVFPEEERTEEFDFEGVHGSVHYQIHFPVGPTTDVLHFDTSIPNGVVVTTRFSLDIVDLDIDSGSSNLRGSVDGNISIHHPIVAYDGSIGFDFSGIPLDHIRVDVIDSSGVPLPEGTQEELLARLLQTHLQTNVGRMALLTVPLVPNADPMLPDELDVRVINDDCAALLVSTCSETVGDPDAFTSSDIPPSANSALIISNYTLLHHIICPYLLDALSLGGAVDEYFSYSDGQSELLHPTSLSHLVDHALVDRITLEDIQIPIEDNSLHAQASVSVRGFG